MTGQELDKLEEELNLYWDEEDRDNYAIWLIPTIAKLFQEVRLLKFFIACENLNGVKKFDCIIERTKTDSITGSPSNPLKEGGLL